MISNIAKISNAAEAGANMQPIVGAEHQVLAQWHSDMARLGLWGPETLSCVVHVPGHWVALTRPEGAQTEQAASLLCDSLHQRPSALSAAEVRQLFSAMARWQQGASLARVQQWAAAQQGGESCRVDKERQEWREGWPWPGGASQLGASNWIKLGNAT